jgi:two-component system sensor histidine kinase KdpD
MHAVFDASRQRRLKTKPLGLKKSSRCELVSVSRGPCARLGRMKKVLAPRPVSWASALAIGTLAPAAAVGIALGLGSKNLAAATALCLLAVVAAGAVAGGGSGIVASFLSFLGLNYFFTEPHHTLAVRHASDVVALVAFLLSALIVGALVSRVREERARAERRATEAQLLNKATERFISSEPLGRILDGLAEALLGLFGLVSAEIATPSGLGRATAGDRPVTAGQTISIPRATGSGSFGGLTVVRAAGEEPFSAPELGLLKTLAAQTALAIERASLDGEVREARLQVETNALRAALFSSVTHDLRTPLASIKASASGLLAEGAHYSEEERRDVLRTIVEEADHLNLIVGNLLDLARMRAGVLVPTRQTMLIEEVIGSVLQRMRRSLEHVVVRTTIRPELPPVDADPIQIGQVLTNIIENAIRFSPPGSEIQIAAARWRSAVQVRVTDQGPGIPPEDRERVFEEFYRHDAGAGRGGTGLGLAIARAVVLAHGGSISATAAPGGGTAVTFELPTVKENEHPDPATLRESAAT